MNQVFSQQPAMEQFGEQDSAMSLVALVNVILDRWIMISICMLLGLLGGGLFLMGSKKIYSIDAMVMIDTSSSGIKGEIEPLEAMLTGELPSEGEIEIIYSRSVLEPVVRSLHLDITAQPQSLPLIQKVYYELFYDKASKTLAEPPMGLFSGYAWGGEVIEVEKLEVPESKLTKKIFVVAGEKGSYKLLNDDDELLLQGEVGSPAQQGEWQLTLKTLKARPGTRFILIRQATYEVTSDLRDSLDVAEQGMKTGILRITYETPFPTYGVKVVNAVTNEYLKQNIARKTEEARQTLSFIDEYAPKSHEELVRAELLVERYREKNRSVEMDAETKGLLDRSGETKKMMSQLDMEMAGSRTSITRNHPDYIAMQSKLNQLGNELSIIEGEINRLPSIQQELLRLERDVNVRSELYTYLLTRAQDLRLIQAGGVGDVSVIDYATVPFLPVRPMPPVIIFISLLFGLSLGLGIAVAHALLHRGVEDAEAIESILPVSVVSIIPYCAAEEKQENSSERMLLSLESPGDVSVESMRTFITSMRMSMIDSPNNIIQVSSASPSAGKSFLSANLAVLLANKGKRIILVDGDLRRGHLHKFFKLPQQGGITAIMAEDISLDQAIVNTDVENLDFLPGGIVPPNPVELLESEVFQQILQTLEESYDYVLIDSPPVLAVADANVIAQYAGANFLVVRAGQSTPHELKEMYRRFNLSNTKVNGIVLNSIRPKAFGTDAYTYYGYEYK